MTGNRDVQLQVQLEQLRERNRDLEAIFNSSFDEIFVTDGAGRCLMVNNSCERLYGLSTCDLIGQTVDDLERDGIFSPSATSLAIKERRRVTIVQRTRTGHTVLVTATPLFDHDRITRVICNSRIVTELQADVKPERPDNEFLQTPDGACPAADG